MHKWLSGAMRSPLAFALVGLRHATRTRPRAASSTALEWASPENRREAASRKWGFFGEDVVPLWVADGDALAPLPVREAVAEAARAGIYGYVDPSPALLDAVCAGIGKSWGSAVDASWVRWHPGLIPALYHCARLAGPQGAVVVPTPVYPPFLNAARDCSQLIELDLGQAGGPLDEKALRATLDRAVATAADGADVVLLWCNPHNPTGRVWRRHEMETVAKACAERNAILASDEVWSGLILDDVPFTPAGLLQVDGLRLISITSASKTYNVAGLDVAFAVVPDDALRRRYFKVGRDQAEPTHAGLAALAAILDATGGSPCVLTPPNGACDGWRRAMVEHLRANRDAAIAFIERECGDLVTVAAPAESTYLLWLDARKLGASPGLFLSQRGVYLTDGAAFGARGYVRLNFCCSRETLDVGLGRIGAACAEAMSNVVNYFFTHPPMASRGRGAPLALLSGRTQFSLREDARFRTRAARSVPSPRASSRPRGDCRAWQRRLCIDPMRQSTSS